MKYYCATTTTTTIVLLLQISSTGGMRVEALITVGTVARKEELRAKIVSGYPGERAKEGERDFGWQMACRPPLSLPQNDLIRDRASIVGRMGGHLRISRSLLSFHDKPRSRIVSSRM